jgi:hypothetical protein
MNIIVIKNPAFTGVPITCLELYPIEIKHLFHMIFCNIYIYTHISLKIIMNSLGKGEIHQNDNDDYVLVVEYE